MKCVSTNIDSVNIVYDNNDFNVLINSFLKGVSHNIDLIHIVYGDDGYNSCDSTIYQTIIIEDHIYSKNDESPIEEYCVVDSMFHAC